MAMKRLLVLLILVGVVFFLPYIWVISLPSIGYLIPLVILVGGGAWLVVRSRQHAPFLIPAISLPLCLYVIYRFLLLVVAPLPSYGLYWFFLDLLWLLVLIIVSDILWQGLSPRRLEVLLIAIGVIFVLADFIYLFQRQQAWGEIAGTMLSLPPIITRSPGLILGHPNLQAAYLNLAIPLVLVRVLRSPGRSRKGISLAVLALLLVGEYLTFSRSGWLAAAAGIGVCLALYFSSRILSVLQRPSALLRRIDRRYLWMAAIATIVIGALLIIAFLQIQQTAHGTPGLRLDIWRSAWEQIKASPIIGNGPGSLAIAFAGRSQAIGVDEVYQAHNLWLQLGAEAGILGVGLVLIAIGLAARAFISAWRSAPVNSPARAALAAYAGIGAGILLHALMDFLFWNANFVIGVVLVVALLYRRAPRTESLAIKKNTMIPILSIALFTLALGRIYLTHQAQPYADALEAASKDDWPTARDQICKAAQADPAATFYLFQCSLANAMVADQTGDAQALEGALAYQRKGLETDPYWYVHWANLASLEWQNGERSMALAHMRQVVEMAPNPSILWINLAWMEEQSNLLEEARIHYQQAGCLSPTIAESVFMQQNELRRAAVKAPCPGESGFLIENPSVRLVSQGVQSLQAGDYSAAQNFFQQAIQSDRFNPIPYSYLGLVYLAQNQTDQARKAAQTALFINPDSTQALLNASRIAEQTGDLDLAAKLRRYLFSLYQRVDFSDRYYTNVYRLPNFPRSLSPFLIINLPTQEGIENLEKLADHLQKTGKQADADQVRDWIENIRR